ncbi:MAG: hypothetical protein ACUVX8_08975 [Candidatus Zipacnadales bacterium]
MKKGLPASVSVIVIVIVVVIIFAVGYFVVMRPKARPGDRGNEVSAPQSQEQGMFVNLDKNGDGSLSQEELAELPEPARRRILRADSDANGIVTQSEMEAITSSGPSGGP